MGDGRVDQRALMDDAHRVAATSMADLARLVGTAAVVTGGALGIGRAVARRLAEAGASVTIVDVHPEVERTARELAAESGREVASVRADVRDADRLASVASASAAAGERLAWVNAAGIFPSHLAEDLDEAAWREVVGIDLDGTWFGSRAAALAARDRGIPAVVVNISSTAGSRAGWPPGIAHYVAAKHGVEGLTKALAVEFGPAGTRAVCIAPSTVVTDGLIDRFGPPGSGDDVYLRAARRMPIARPSLPDDVARVVAFCVSDAAAMLTGCVIPVDGGHLAT